MYLKIKKKKYEVVELNKFWERFKGLKFVLDPINFIVRFPKKRFITTNFLCQRIDIVLTDKDDNILYIYENFASEKYILPKFKVYNVYFFPLNTACNFKVGEQLKIKN